MPEFRRAAERLPEIGAKSRSQKNIEIRTRPIGAADRDSSCSGQSSARYAANNRHEQKDVIDGRRNVIDGRRKEIARLPPSEHGLEGEASRATRAPCPGAPTAVRSEIVQGIVLNQTGGATMRDKLDVLAAALDHSVPSTADAERLRSRSTSSRSITATSATPSIAPSTPP